MYLELVRVLGVNMSDGDCNYNGKKQKNVVPCEFGGNYTYKYTFIKVQEDRTSTSVGIKVERSLNNTAVVRCVRLRPKAVAAGGWSLPLALFFIQSANL